jgi:hypothetical protein
MLVSEWSGRSVNAIIGTYNHAGGLVSKGKSAQESI